MSPLRNIPLTELIQEIESRIEDATVNLPYELFLFIYRNATLSHTDIIIRHPQKGVLLTWRDDEIFGPCWHIPGRIIRYKNTIEQTLLDCLRIETGLTDIDPARIMHIGIYSQQNEHIRDRGHAIAAGFEISITDDELEKIAALHPEEKEARWFTSKPENMFDGHPKKYYEVMF